MKKLTLKRTTLGALAIGGLVFAQATTALADRATVVRDAIWVHDELYGTVATDTAFRSPPAHSTDIIYSFAGSGLEGQRSVAEHAPGDRGYNGGRWNVMAVTFTEDGLAIHDMDGDGTVDFELTNAEAVKQHEQWGHLTIEEAGVYFECPLRPQRGRR